MSLPSKTDEISLKVAAEGPGTEIFLLDDQSRQMARAVGSLRTRQPPGVYKIRFRAGYATREQIILLLDTPVEVNCQPLAFFSPVPLEGTAGYVESHAKAAEKLSRGAKPVVAGEGARIFFFARDCGGAAEAGSPGVQPLTVENPADGLSLKSVAGKTLVDLAQKSEVEGGKEPWAFCAVEVAPGPYVLSLKTPDGKVLEQTVYAPRGWHAQVFLTQRLQGGDMENRAQKAPDLCGAALLLSENKCFNSDDRDARLTELARVSLSNRRRVVAGELREMLRRKFEHPMLGIYGAHLLLLEEELDAPLYQIVLDNLRHIFKDAHPDVEALSLATDMGATSHVFSVPPMLRRGWSLVVKATAKRPELVPLGSPAARVADCVLGSEPWLTWVPPEQAAAAMPAPAGAAIRSDLEAALEAFLVPFTSSSPSSRFSLPALIGDVAEHQNPTYSKLIGYGQGLVAKLIQFVSEESGKTLEQWGLTRLSELTLDDEQITTLVEHLGLPRHNVELLLLRNSRHLQVKINKARAEQAHAEPAAEVIATADGE